MSQHLHAVYLTPALLRRSDGRHSQVSRFQSRLIPREFSDHDSLAGIAVRADAFGHNAPSWAN